MRVFPKAALLSKRPLSNGSIIVVKISKNWCLQVPLGDWVCIYVNPWQKCVKSLSPERLLANETYIQADLADLSAMTELLQGADMVVHFGAIGDEAPMEALWGPNFIGAYNVWIAKPVI